MNILSPLAAGINATPAEEKEARPMIANTIPIHTDLVMGAGIIPVDRRFKWTIGGQTKEGKPAVENKLNRKLYVHLPMTKNGHSKIKLDGRDDAVLHEGDGAYVKGVNVGDVLNVESIGEAEAEVVMLDTY